MFILHQSWGRHQWGHSSIAVKPWAISYPSNKTEKVAKWLLHVGNWVNIVAYQIGHTPPNVNMHTSENCGRQRSKFIYILTFYVVCIDSVHHITALWNNSGIFTSGHWQLEWMDVNSKFSLSSTFFIISII